ncbi:MAG: hypothetical protein ABFD03_08215 [Clostridiaceae bacterium]
MSSMLFGKEFMVNLQCLTDETLSTCGSSLKILNGKQETIIPIRLIAEFDLQLPDTIQNGVIRISTVKPRIGSVIYSIGGIGAKNEIILIFLEKDLAAAKAIQRYAKTFAFRFAFYSRKSKRIDKSRILQQS